MGRILVFVIISVFVGLAVILLFNVLTFLFIAALVGAVVVAGVWAVTEIIGLFKGDDDEHVEKKTASKGNDDEFKGVMVEKELQSMKRDSEVRRNVQQR